MGLSRFIKRVCALGVLIISMYCYPTMPHADEVIQLQKVAEGVYAELGIHEPLSPTNFGAIANLGVVIGDDGVAVIDSGGSFHHGQQFIRAIRSLTDRPIKYVINTHMHPDHVFGNNAFAALHPRPVFIGHHKLKRALAQRAAFYLENIGRQVGAGLEGTKVVLPDEGVKDTRILELGNRQLVLTAHPTAHTDNDLTVLDKRTSTLFTGDLLFQGHIPVIDGSLLGWLKVSETLASGQYSRVIPGHGTPMSGIEEGLGPQSGYLVHIRDQIRTFIRDGKTLAEAVETIGLDQKHKWKRFDGNHQRNVTTGFAELEWED